MNQTAKIQKTKKWTDVIQGMKIYTSVQITKALESAGFKDIKTDKNKNWLCIVCKKTNNSQTEGALPLFGCYLFQHGKSIINMLKCSKTVVSSAEVPILNIFVV